MQQLFELKIFESIRPNRVSFTTEFNKQCGIVSTDYDMLGEVPTSYRYTCRCVEMYLKNVLHQNSEEYVPILSDIVDAILTLHKAGMIDYNEARDDVLDKLKQ